MPRSDAETALIDGFSTEYALTGNALLQDIEQSVCGCSYGASSWTTRAEADSAIDMLGLAPGKRLLDIGTGCGWPGLYLASASGCEAMLLDMPFSGLLAAARRAAEDGMAGRCLPVQGDGAAIPFADESFDAVFHSDVLCCLDPKLDVLHECRRVIRGSGTMVFSVLSVRPGLSTAEAAQAATLGPAFVASPHDYPTLLDMAGWTITKHLDVSANFRKTVASLLAAEEQHLKSLADLRGEQRQTERLATMRKRQRGVVSQLICREVFQVAPAPG
jgi:ubiquinone/menaquinone biosynthesis C-methylase UbiE